jgi:hypothetical protein
LKQRRSMAESRRPPGGPLNPEFRNAIDELAKQAREQDLLLEEEAKRRAAPRPFQKFVLVGVGLIVVQAALFAYLYHRRSAEITKKPVVTKPLLPDSTCNAALYRTYWKVVSYMRDEGRPPESLELLLGKYLDKLPLDPATGQPLRYSTDGQRFDLSCPAGGPKR